MKRLLKGVVFFALVLCTALALVACGAKVDEIEIESGNEPQLTYVLGSDLNLSKGKLTVRKEGTREEIPLDSEGIAVSGYDKNKTGKQELTVEYGGKTTAFTVTVVERMRAENFEQSYFIGESFDTAKGVLRITRDDGTSFTVPLSSEQVTLEGFSSDAAGAVELTATYAGEETYRCTLTANVYPIEDSAFTRPNKINYRSHETELNLAGGYITLIGNGGKVRHYVPLTADMVSGFDLGEATFANRTTPLKQTLSVDYAGLHHTYEISITFSAVSVIRSYAAQLEALDWSEVPAIGEELGAHALEALDLYLSLPQEDRPLISAETAAFVARGAAVRLHAIWTEQTAPFAEDFAVKGGVLYLTSPTRDRAEAFRAALANAEEPPAFFATAEKLGSVKNLFKDIPFDPAGEEGGTLGDYLSDVCTRADFGRASLNLKTLVDAHDALASFPAEWTEETLTANAEAVQNAYAVLAASTGSGDAYRDMFGTLGQWREKKDFFDILYAYYLNIWLNAEDGSQELTAAQNALITLEAHQYPGELEPLYRAAIAAFNQLYGIYNMQINDNTLFRMYALEALASEDRLLDGGNILYLQLYTWIPTPSMLTISEMMTGYVKLFHNYDGAIGQVLVQGLYYQDYNFLGEGVHEKLWADYLALVRMDLEGKSGATAFGTALENLLHSFVETSPLHQFSFLSSLNHFYRNGLPEYALSLGDTVGSSFALYLKEYYGKVLTAGEFELFGDLLTALEDYSRVQVTNETYAKTFLDGFMNTTEAAIEKFGALTAEEQSDFTNRLGFLYTRCTELLGFLRETPQTPSLGTWQETFSKLDDLLYRVYRAGSTTSQKPFIALLGAMEEADELVQKILTEGGEEIVHIFSDVPFTHAGFQDSNSYTFDYLWFSAREYYRKALMEEIKVGNNIPVWELYRTGSLKPFVHKASDLIWKFIDSSVAASDWAQVQETLLAFRSLENADQVLFYTIDGSAWFESALMGFWKTVLTDAVSDFAQTLLKAQRYYVYAVYSPGAESEDGTTMLDQFKKYMNSLAYSLSNNPALAAEACYKTYVKELYDYYLAKYNELTATTEKAE